MSGIAPENKLIIIINKTIEQVATFKNPDTSEFQTRINPILRAMGEKESTLYGKITELVWGNDKLEISYMAATGSDKNIQIPKYILTDIHPMAAATEHRLNETIKKLKYRLETLENSLNDTTKALSFNEKELANLQALRYDARNFNIGR